MIELGVIGSPQGLQPQVGDLYAGGGRKDKTAYWLVVGAKPDSTTFVCLGLDAEGNVVSSANYYSHALKTKTLLGHKKLGITWGDVS